MISLLKFPEPSQMFSIVSPQECIGNSATSVGEKMETLPSE
jgi:hypothetical protein